MSLLVLVVLTVNRCHIVEAKPCVRHLSEQEHKPTLLKEERQFFTFLVTKLIRLYQIGFSYRQGEVCNFTPSCSNYANEAIKTYGLRGVIMTFDRLERCNYFAWQYRDRYYKVKWVEGRGYKLYDPLRARGILPRP